MLNPVLIGVAGGTGAGKTTFSQAIIEAVGSDETLLVSQDAYYHDHAELGLEERAKINYDHPRAFDFDLLVHDMSELKAGRPVPRLAYDYVTHSRKEIGGLLEPKKIIILEGILALEDQALRSVMDIKLYIDADADVRLLRRLKRDIEERGRTLENVTKQYLDEHPWDAPTKYHLGMISAREGDTEAAEKYLHGIPEFKTGIPKFQT